MRGPGSWQQKTGSRVSLRCARDTTSSPTPSPPCLLPKPQLFENLVVVLAERRRRRVDARAAVRELEGRERHAEAALHAVGGGVLVNDAARRDVRVGQRLGHGAHAAGRDVPRLQECLPFVGGARQHDLFQHRDLAVVVGVALVVGLLDHVGAAEQRPKPALLTQVAGADHHQRAVLGLERAVGGVRMAVAARLGLDAVAQISGHVRPHQGHRHVEHRHVDALALAGALALEQRGGEREGAGDAGRVVDRRRAELDRVHVLGAGRRHDAGGRLDDVVVGGLRAARPAVAETPRTRHRSAAG